MTPEQETVYVIKGAISELPAQQRHDCETAAEEIRKIVRNAGDVGSMALALVGAETATMLEDRFDEIEYAVGELEAIDGLPSWSPPAPTQSFN